MSTYFVFGMTEGAAREIAYKAALKDNVPAKDLPEEIASGTEKIMEGTKIVQLGGPFDAPSFANEYIELAERTQRVRGLHIKARNRTGAFKDGRPVLEWKDVPRS